MTNKNDKEDKIIKSFFVAGLNEFKLQKYNEEINLRYIQNVDLLNIKLPTKNDRYDRKNEKWLCLSKNTNSWLRIQYTDKYNEPITELKMAECLYKPENNNNYLFLQKKYFDLGYMPISVSFFQNNNQNNDQFPLIKNEITDIIQHNEKYVKIPFECNVKKYIDLHLKFDAVVILINRKYKYLPLRDIIIQKSQNSKFFNFKILKHKSPFFYKYMPEILDFYPSEENLPSSISLFCFPEGISIKEKYELPYTFSFVLTDEIGNRTYGSTIIFLEELSNNLREFFIPIFNDESKIYYCQKCICVLSRYPFYYNCQLFLKELYRLSVSNCSKIPLERAICTFVDSLYIQPYNKILRFFLNDDTFLDFYRIPNYGKLWDTNDIYLKTLFKLLSIGNIITLWEALLLEKKIILLCSSKNCLLQISHALINLIFPFNWIHVFVPILPEKLKMFIESPVPFLIGIPFNINIDKLQECIIFNINKNKFENYDEKLPELPNKINKILFNKLSKFKNLYDPNNIEEWMKLQDAVFPSSNMSKLNNCEIDTCEIRDAFYSVFIDLFKNYDKHFDYKESIGIENNKKSNKKFLKEAFLKEHNSSQKNSFLSLLCETNLFMQFEDLFRIDEKINNSMAFFLDTINNSPKIKNKYLIDIKPKNVVFAQKIEISDLNGQTFYYSCFPKLNPKLYLNYEKPKKIYKSKFLYLRDEWCYDIKKFKLKDWPKYYLYLIYDIWFTFFSFVLNVYEDNQAIILMDFALTLIEDLYNKKKISPTRNLFSKILKSCGRTCLTPFVKKMLTIANKVYKNSKLNSLFHNAYLNGLYALSENVNDNFGSCLVSSLTNSLLLVNSLRQSIIQEIQKTHFNIENKLTHIIFIPYNICENCLQNKSIIKKIFYSEILSGFINNVNDYENYSVCTTCFAKFIPKIYFFTDDQDNLFIQEKNFFSPKILIKEIDEFIKNKGEIGFYQNDEWTDIYWNLIFYFQLFDLPNFVLYVQNNMDKFEVLKNQLNINKLRRSNTEKKPIKKFFSNILTTYKSSDTQNNMDKSNNSNTSIYSYNNIMTPSSSEMEIWKKNHEKKMLNSSLTHIPIGKNEDKNEMLLKIKEMKSFLNEIFMHFTLSSQEKLDNFLSKYFKILNEKQNDYFNYIKRENINKKKLTLANTNIEKLTQESNKEKLNKENVNKEKLSLENSNKEKLTQENNKQKLNQGIINKEDFTQKYFNREKLSQEMQSNESETFSMNTRVDYKIKNMEIDDKNSEYMKDNNLFKNYNEKKGDLINDVRLKSFSNLNNTNINKNPLMNKNLNNTNNINDMNSINSRNNTQMISSKHNSRNKSNKKIINVPYNYNQLDLNMINNNRDYYNNDNINIINEDFIKNNYNQINSCQNNMNIDKIPNYINTPINYNNIYNINLNKRNEESSNKNMDNINNNNITNLNNFDNISKIRNMENKKYVSPIKKFYTNTKFNNNTEQKKHSNRYNSNYINSYTTNYFYDVNKQHNYVRGNAGNEINYIKNDKNILYDKNLRKENEF